MIKKGFTLIELLVVIVIIGILVAIALPNFIKVKDKAKEAEIKQNLHALQLALERYHVDAGADYPYFLYGGEASVNMGTAWHVYGIYPYVLGHPGNRVPFDMFLLTNVPWRYSAVTWPQLVDGSAGGSFGDSLAYEGYLPRYPKNPFQMGQGRRNFDLSLLPYFQNYHSGFGGRDGSHMWSTGPWGEQPTFLFFSNVVPDNHAWPGNFYYHPRWSDGATNYGHYTHQNRTAWNNGATNVANTPSGSPNDGSIPAPNGDVASLEVSGYDLLATGSSRTKGQDLDISIMSNSGYFNQHKWRRGYLVLGQERNPWNANYAESTAGDSFPDRWIIHLSSGLDKKSGLPTDV